MTDAARDTKIMRTWSTLCDAYPALPADRVAAMVARRCKTTVAHALAVWYSV